jgi:hypothetical protein
MTTSTVRSTVGDWMKTWGKLAAVDDPTLRGVGMGSKNQGKPSAAWAHWPRYHDPASFEQQIKSSKSSFYFPCQTEENKIILGKA